MTDPSFLPIAQSLLREGRSVRFAAGGQSMRPVIRDGDILTVAPFAGRGLFPGDVVMHLGLDGRYYVHRLLLPARGKAWFIKGDAMPGAPDRVPLADILGRVVLRERGGRQVVFDSCRWRLAGVLLAAAAPLTIWLGPRWSQTRRRLHAPR